ncbi:helix-turn-helix domain-containing protein [Aestuariivirga sp.]|uniref:helix-turn-helix domain-containing protein n=1 Tax=Aestuariivirga sp. TaxID=2650926 RepID=UPI0039E72948
MLKEAPRPPGRETVNATELQAERIGSEIRELRKARRLTIKTLSERIGVSVGYLSEIERGLASPNVKALHDIATALGVTIGWFFHATDAAEPGEHEFFVRAPNRRIVHFASGITDELLSPHLRGSLELLMSRFPPGASSGSDPYTHNGEEAGIVISGALELWVGDKRMVLEEGDSFGFESSVPHRYCNTGEKEAVVIWAITPPSY